MRKETQPTDSVWTSTAATAVVEQPTVDENIGVTKIGSDEPVKKQEEFKVETENTSKKKDEEDNDVVPLSLINKASESSDQ